MQSNTPSGVLLPTSIHAQSGDHQTQSAPGVIVDLYPNPKRHINVDFDLRPKWHIIDLDPPSKPGATYHR